MLYGVIDIGSNTIRFMIYRVDNGAIHPVLTTHSPRVLRAISPPRGK